MSLEEKKIEDETIDRFMDMFTKHLDVDNILDKCLSKGLITANDMSKINATLKGGGTAQAIRDLMLCVKRSPPGYLKTFCGILNDSKSSFLAPYIEELYVRARKFSNICSHLSIMSDALHKVNDMDINLHITRLFLDLAIGKYTQQPHHYRFATSRFSSHAVSYSGQEVETQLNRITFRNFHLPILQEAPNMLHEVGDVLEDAGVEASVERYKGLCLNSDNVYRQFTENIGGVLDTGPHSELTWKKVVTYFSSAAAFGIHLHTNNMGHLATQLPVWMAQVLHDRVQPWIDDQGGWESFLSYGKDVLSRAKSMKKKKQWRSPAVNHSNKMYGRIHANWDEF